MAGLSPHVQRAELLLTQSRYDLAEQELRQELAGDPGNALAHALLAVALREREDYAAARAEAQQAVHLGPDSDFGHYVLATVLARMDRLKEAEQAILEALRLDPMDADYHALHAGVLLDRKRWQEALEAAERGLRSEAEHVTCVNFRARALVQLGRREEAATALHGALARDPDNAFTHANRGWSLLHEGRPQPALDHFREALRLDPELEYARHGIIQALRARNPVYRVMLAYFLWMSRLRGRTQWLLIIGVWLAVRGLRSVGQALPELQPYVRVVVILYLVFVFLSWSAAPLADLLLRLSRYGRLALTRAQTMASNWVGGLVGSALVLTALSAMTAFRLKLPLVPAVFAVMMILPVSATFNATKTRPRWILGGYTLLLAATGIGAMVLFMVDPVMAVTPALAFLFGWMLFSWVANIVNSL